jgi:translation initiation factor 1 (eIF-1/SUI1)
VRLRMLVQTFVTSAADFCCNGTVVEDDELGQVIQLQGDQRKNVAQFLLEVTWAGFPASSLVETNFVPAVCVCSKAS